MTKREAIREIFEKYGLMADDLVMIRLEEMGYKVGKETFDQVFSERTKYRSELQDEQGQLRRTLLWVQKNQLYYVGFPILKRIHEVEILLQGDDRVTQLEYIRLKNQSRKKVAENKSE